MTAARQSVRLDDLSLSLCKSFVFSGLMAWIATYRGYHTSGGAQGVGISTTQAVVEASASILAADYILTALV